MKRLITLAWAVLALGLLVQEGQSDGFDQSGTLPAGFSPTPDSMTLLNSGQVLFTLTNHADLYDPVAGTWTVTGSLGSMAADTATRLQNGGVLAISGPAPGTLNTAKIYNPTTGAWTATGPMAAAHGIDYSVTVLTNGQVLVAGGLGTGGLATKAAEVFDPASGTWTATSPLNLGRIVHTATLLANGSVLVAGGWNPGTADASLAEAELYNPATRLWSPAGVMSAVRGGATATLLADGNVLVAGGGADVSSSVLYSSAELYVAGNNYWTLVGSMTVNRFEHSAARLTNGQVLVTGGYTVYNPSGDSYNSTATAETYDPVSQTWTATGGHMHLPRVWLNGVQPMALLPDGQVLVAGGGASGTAALDFYDPTDTLYLDYTTNGDGVTITNYTGNAGVATVPAVINGLPVAGIGNNAFYQNTAVTAVVISNGVANIGNSAFANCASLTNATIPGSVTNLGSKAFYGCTSLTNLTLTNGLISIGVAAFEDSLTGVTIPATVTNIGLIAFSTLQAINVDPANVWYSSQGGVLFSQGGTVLIEAPQLTGKYTIPSGVLDVGAEAFVSCSALTSVLVPATVTQLEDDAFVSCPALAGLYFYGNAPTLGSAGPFQNSTHPTIYYIAGTSGWGSTFDNLITATWTPPPPAPTIETQPASSTNFAGAVVTLLVQAIGTGPFSYQWQFDGTNLAGASASSYVLTNAQPANAGNYQVIVANSGGSVTSRVATVTIKIPDTTKPTIALVSPSSGLQVSNATFTVRGTAGDNVAVAGVFYLLNQTGWNSAVTTNGWTNWTASVTLAPGTNAIAVYAMDTSGNVSTTNRVSCVYVLSATLAVSTNGLGSLSPNDNGALLQVGKNYSITATPGAGFVFSNWTGGTSLPLGFITNKATVQFEMVSNLLLQAGFMDVQKPVAAITNLAAGQRVSSAPFVVKGTASDNWQVANVWVQLNDGGWTNAIGTNNWSASLNLTPGTNTVQAYASDNSGNLSATNTVTFDYVVTNQLQLRSIGLGTFSPNDSNAWLEIGRNYTLAATHATGFIFTNWTVSTNWLGGTITTNATLQFMMESNLTLQAAFVEVTAPTVAITNLLAGQRVSSAPFVVKGTAGDNWQVTNVWVQLNDGGWTNATGTNNWSASLNLIPGTNTVQAYASNISGHLSATNTVTFDYVVTNQLQLRTVGLGAFSPNDSNAWLEIGRNYTLAATHATGFVFTNWTVSTNWLGGAITTNATVQFMMASNLTVQAAFVEVTAPTVAITNLVAGQRVSSAPFVVKGTAGDNWQVTNVWVQLNDGGWTNATGTNNWSASLNLIPGTNTVQAYASNISGHLSATNTVTFDYVVTNQLQLRTVGLGAFSPNDSNAWLEIGRNYTLAATHATGFVFTNWTVSTNWLGGAITTNATVQFMMASNLTVQAAFVEVTAPTVAITNLAANQRTSNSVITVRGVTSDNWQVTNVWCGSAASGWLPAFSTNKFKNWSVTNVSLSFGTNTIRVYAVNLGGLYSGTNSVTVLATNVAVLTADLKSVPSVVSRPGVFITGLQLTPVGLAFRLQISGAAAGSIQVSTNLMGWDTMTHFVGTNTILNFCDPAATNSHSRFYRAEVP